MLACGALGSAAPALAEQAAPKYPSSIVVIGHSGGTGFDSTAPLPKAWGFRKKMAGLEPQRLGNRRRPAGQRGSV